MFFPSFYHFFSVSIFHHYLFLSTDYSVLHKSLYFFLLYSFLFFTKSLSLSYKLLNLLHYPIMLSASPFSLLLVHHSVFFPCSFLSSNPLTDSLILCAYIYPILSFYPLHSTYSLHCLQDTCVAIFPQALNIIFISPFFLLPRLPVLIPFCAFPYWSPSSVSAHSLPIPSSHLPFPSHSAIFVFSISR